MLALFKGELDYETITRGMPYSHMIALRDCRVEQLVEEKKQFDKEQEALNKQHSRL